MDTGNKYLVSFIFVACFSTAGAQNNIGILSGVGLYKPSITHAPGSEKNSIYTNVAPVYGIFTVVPLSKEFAFRPVASISHRSITNEESIFTYSLPANYVDLLLPVVHPVKIKDDKLYVGAGPAVSILLNANYQGYHLKTVDIGMNGMVAYEIPIGFSLNLNYILGLINLSKQPASGTTFRNRLFSITLGYLF